jgi:RNA-directed DNA polymerase
MVQDEDYRTAVFGKTERTVGWEGDGEPAMTGLVRHCMRGNPQRTGRPGLKSLNHSFTLDLVILIDAHPQHDWLMKAVEKRLREELAKLDVQINEEKSRVVNLERGERFGFLGFDFRRVRSLQGAWRPQYTPKMKKRTALLREIKEVFRRYRSQPVARVIEIINPMLRGWVNYFAIGHSARCFRYIRDWIAKKVRRHMMQARGRNGFGWKRWSTQWLYQTLGLFNDYRVRYILPKARPTGAVS